MSPHRKRCWSAFAGMLIYLGILFWFYDLHDVPLVHLYLLILHCVISLVFFAKALRELNSLYVIPDSKEPPR